MTHYAGFVGAHLHGSVPINEDMLNEVIETIGGGASRSIHHLRVNFYDQNHIVVTGIVRKWFFSKRFAVELWIEPDIDFQRAPVLRAWLPRSSMIGSLAHLFTTFGILLPRGVHVTGQLVEIDLGGLLYQANLPELVSWIKVIHVRVVRGQLVLSFVARVDPTPTQYANPESILVPAEK